MLLFFNRSGQCLNSQPTTVLNAAGLIAVFHKCFVGGGYAARGSESARSILCEGHRCFVWASKSSIGMYIQLIDRATNRDFHIFRAFLSE